MTLSDLQNLLAGFPETAALTFETAQGPAAKGYHVTEFKLSRVTGVDCGGRVDQWQEALMQIMDGYGGKAMSVGKFRAIVDKSLSSVDGLGDADLRADHRHTDHEGADHGPVCRGIQHFERTGERAIAATGAVDDRGGHAGHFLQLGGEHPGCDVLKVTRRERHNELHRGCGIFSGRRKRPGEDRAGSHRRRIC